MDGTSHTNGVIDTDILIDATKGRKDAIAFLIEQRAVGIQISIISAMELVVGSRDLELQLSSTIYLSILRIRATFT